MTRINAIYGCRWGILGLFGALMATGVIPRTALPALGAFAALGGLGLAGLFVARWHRDAGLALARAMILLDGTLALFAAHAGWPGGDLFWPVPVLALLAEGVAFRQWRALWGAAGAYLVLCGGAFLTHRMTLPHTAQAVGTVMVGALVAHVLSGLKGRDDRLDVGERRLGSVVESAASLANSPDLSTMLADSLGVALRESSGSAGYVLLTDEANPDELVAEVARGDQEFDFPRSLAVGEGLSGYAVQMRQLVAVGSREGDRAGDCDGMALAGRAAVSLPLLARTYTGATGTAGDQILGALTVIGPEGRDGFDGGDLQVLQSVSSMMAVAVANARMENRQRTTFLATLQSLAQALEARDEYTRGHSQRVCEVSLMLGEALGFTAEALEELRIGTILHDIGKIGVPDAVLNKQSRLTDEEFAVMKSHPVIGYEICKPLMLSEGVLMIIRNHHEKLDGSGYPDGLKGGELPPPLRVVCVADAFDAMSSSRPYRTVMAIERVVAELSKGAGVQFDPVIVEALKNLIATDRLRELYRQYWEPAAPLLTVVEGEERRAA